MSPGHGCGVRGTPRLLNGTHEHRRLQKGRRCPQWVESGHSIPAPRCYSEWKTGGADYAQMLRDDPRHGIDHRPGPACQRATCGDHSSVSERFARAGIGCGPSDAGQSRNYASVGDPPKCRVSDETDWIRRWRRNTDCSCSRTGEPAADVAGAGNRATRRRFCHLSHLVDGPWRQPHRGSFCCVRSGASPECPGSRCESCVRRRVVKTCCLGPDPGSVHVTIANDRFGSKAAGPLRVESGS